MGLIEVIIPNLTKSKKYKYEKNVIVESPYNQLEINPLSIIGHMLSVYSECF